MLGFLLVQGNSIDVHGIVDDKAEAFASFFVSMPVVADHPRLTGRTPQASMHSEILQS